MKRAQNDEPHESYTFVDELYTLMKWVIEGKVT